MNKKLLVLPLVALTMIGCGGSNGGGGQGGGGGGGDKDAITVSQALEVIKNLADGASTPTDYTVAGYVSTGFTPKESSQTAGSWNFNIGDTADSSSTLIIWWAAASKAPVQGKKINVKGKLTKFGSGTSTKSELTDGTVTWMEEGGDTPTPTPSGTSDGIAGANASKTGSKTGTKLTFDFTGGTISGITATSSSSPQSSGVATVDSYQFNFTNAIAHVATEYVETGYLGLCTKTPKAVASFANKTAIPGNITAIEVTMPKEKSSGSVSALAPAVVDLGTSALGATALTGGQTGGSEAVLTAYAASGFNGSYFSVSIVQGVSSTSKATWYNACIASISVWYN